MSILIKRNQNYLSIEDKEENDLIGSINHDITLLKNYQTEKFKKKIDKSLKSIQNNNHKSKYERNSLCELNILLESKNSHIYKEVKYNKEKKIDKIVKVSSDPLYPTINTISDLSMGYNKKSFKKSVISYFKSSLESEIYYTDEEKNEIFLSLFMNNDDALKIKSFLLFKFSVEEKFYFSSTEEAKTIIKSHKNSVNKHKPIYNLNPIYSKLYGSIIKDIVNKPDSPYMIYSNFEILFIQMKFLSLISKSLLKKVKNLDLIYFHSKTFPNGNYDFKMFSSNYGQNIKKIQLFNKMSNISKNMKEASLIWPFIKKEDVSQILSLESIYDAIFNKS